MVGWVRKHLEVIGVAFVTAAVTAGGPAVAGIIADYAHDSDKVDGLHAVGSASTIVARKGDLVATNPLTGRLPNNIIFKAPDADRVDGFGAKDLIRLTGTDVTDNLGDWDGSPLVDRVTVETPAAGFLLLTYTANLGRDVNATASGTRYYSATPRLDGVPIGGASPSQFASLDFSCGAGIGCAYQTLSVQRVVAVTAGTHEVTVDLSATGGASTDALAFVFERSLAVLFVPFDGTGVPPAPPGPVVDAGSKESGDGQGSP